MTLRHGQPDWGINPYEVAGQPVDPAAAAEFAALGIVRVDSFGRPLVFDNFANGIAAWSLGGAGAGHKASATNLAAYSGAVSARLDPGSTGAGQQIMQRFLYFVPSNRCGLEVAVNFDNAPVNRFDIWFSLNASGLGPNVFYNGVSGRWFITKGSGGVQQLASGLGITAGWQLVKVVVDFALGQYVAAIVGDIATPTTRQDLSGITLPAMPGNASILFIANGTGAGQTTNIGYSLLTQDEP